MPEEDEIRTELMGLLRYANATAVGKALGVSAQTVTNWARGRHPSQARLDQVRALYGLPVGSQGTTKESPPAWAEGLVVVRSYFGTGAPRLIVKGPAVTSTSRVAVAPSASRTTVMVASPAVCPTT